MKLKLTRKRLFLLGVVVLMLIGYTQRLNFIYNGTITKGIVIALRHQSSYSARYGSVAYTLPVIEYNIENEKIIFNGSESIPCTVGESISVIYENGNPNNRYIFSFWGFWFAPLAYIALPLLILYAACYSFMSKADSIYIGKNQN